MVVEGVACPGSVREATALDLAVAAADLAAQDPGVAAMAERAPAAATERLAQRVCGRRVRVVVRDPAQAAVPDLVQVGQMAAEGDSDLVAPEASAQEQAAAQEQAEGAVRAWVLASVVVAGELEEAQALEPAAAVVELAEEWAAEIASPEGGSPRLP